MIASARLATWSLAKMLEMWLLTVLGASPSRAAMAALARPVAMRPSTSRSRAVSSGNAVGSERGAGQVGQRTSGDSGAEDRLAGRDGRDGADHVGGGRALEDVAERAGAHRREHRLVVLEHGQHQDARRRARPGRSRRVASMPFIPGIWMSMMMTSGRSGDGGAYRVVAGGDDLDHLVPVDGGQQRAQSFLHDGVVVGDDDPQGHAGRLRTGLSGRADVGGDTDRQQHVDPAAGAVELDGAPSAELGGPFADRGQPDARLPSAADVHPVIMHRHLQLVRRAASVTTADVAVECRVTFVSASVTMR